MDYPLKGTDSPAFYARGKHHRCQQQVYIAQKGFKQASQDPAPKPRAKGSDNNPSWRTKRTEGVENRPRYIRSCLPS